MRTPTVPLLVIATAFAMTPFVAADLATDASPLQLVAPSASETGSGDPEPYDCLVYPHPGNPVLKTLHDAECGVGSMVWDLFWYYPPGVYQVWCFATGECPCPHCPPESVGAKNE